MGFLEKLAQILGRKPTPAVEECPRKKGIVCIVVSRQDKTNTGIPDVKVSLSGPTPGQAVTDANGIAEFPDRTPGAYEFGVSFPSPKFKAWNIVDYSINLGVGPGQVAIGDVFAFPTGTLVVEIRDDEGKLVADAADVSTAGVASLAFRAPKGTHSFKQVACGDYTVSAQLSTDAYESSWVEAPGKVTVAEGGTATAVLTVIPMTWIGVRVHDKDAKTDVARVAVQLKATGGVRLVGKKDASGVHKFAVSKKLKTCEIDELVAEDDDVFYEVVDVTSA